MGLRQRCTYLCVNMLNSSFIVKSIKRTGWVRRGVCDPEHVADHMYMMAVMAFFIKDEHKLCKERLVFGTCFSLVQKISHWLLQPAITYFFQLEMLVCSIGSEIKSHLLILLSTKYRLSSH